MTNNYVEMAKAFNDKIKEIRKGLDIVVNDKVASELDMTVDELLRRKGLVNKMLHSDNIIRVNELKRSGYTATEIAHLLDKGESWVRYMLSEDEDVAAAAIEIYAKKLGYTE